MFPRVGVGVCRRSRLFALRRLNNTENREQRTADRLVLEMLLFKNRRTKSSRNFQKQLLQLFLIKSTNRRNYWDACHVEMGIRSKSSKCRFSIGSAAGQTDGPTGQGPRNVTFQKSSHLSKFSATPTLLDKIDESSKLLRWVPRWDGHQAGVLEFLLFNRLGRWTTGRRLFTVYWLHSVFLRSNFRTWQCIHNVSMIQKWILHMKLSTKVNFLVWKSASFATKISVY